jgi:hypothetical protein
MAECQSLPELYTYLLVNGMLITAALDGPEAVYKVLSDNAEDMLRCNANAYSAMVTQCEAASSCDAPTLAELRQTVVTAVLDASGLGDVIADLCAEYASLSPEEQTALRAAAAAPPSDVSSTDRAAVWAKMKATGSTCVTALTNYKEDPTFSKCTTSAVEAGLITPGSYRSLGANYSQIAALVSHDMSAADRKAVVGAVAGIYATGMCTILSGSVDPGGALTPFRSLGALIGGATGEKIGGLVQDALLAYATGGASLYAATFGKLVDTVLDLF